MRVVGIGTEGDPVCDGEDIKSSEERIVVGTKRGRAVSSALVSHALRSLSIVLLVAFAAPQGAKASKKGKVKDLVAQLKKCESLEECPAVKALVRQRKTFWPKLSVGLEDPDEMIRFWTLGVLSKAPTPKAVSAIAFRLDDAKIRVRAAAA